MSWLTRFGQRIANGVVDLGQGTTPHQTLDSSRAFTVVSVIAGVAIVGSVWLIGRDIHLATRIPSIANTNSSAALAQLNSLKNKDTDQDGLSDYDELVTTHTSPYLKDSDGDGKTDLQELNAGNDPNCPQGKICSSFFPLTTSSATDANGNINPTFLRAALQAAGVPKTQLDQTDDATLLRIYQQIAGTQPTTNTNTGSANTNSTNISLNTNSSASFSQLQNLTPTQIRQLLVQNGVDASTLQNINDTTLQQIFQQAVQSSS